MILEFWRKIFPIPRHVNLIRIIPMGEKPRIKFKHVFKAKNLGFNPGIKKQILILNQVLGMSYY
jgi:hypothetical protein